MSATVVGHIRLAGVCESVPVVEVVEISGVLLSTAGVKLLPRRRAVGRPEHGEPARGIVVGFDDGPALGWGQEVVVHRILPGQDARGSGDQRSGSARGARL